MGIRISLDRKDFQDLIRGKIITKNASGKELKICLQDIGYSIMAYDVKQAMEQFLEQ